MADEILQIEIDVLKANEGKQAIGDVASEVQRLANEYKKLYVPQKFVTQMGKATTAVQSQAKSIADLSNSIVILNANLARSIVRMNDLGSATKSAVPSGGISRGRSGGGRIGGGMPIGPAQNLLNAQAGYRRAAIGGNAAYMMDAAFNLQKKQAAYQKAFAPPPQQPTPWQNFRKAAGNVVYSSRFNMGGVSPLVGRSVNAVQALIPAISSLGPVAGAAAIGVIGVTAALGALMAGAVAGANISRGMSAAQFAAGGTGAQMTTLAGIGGALGIDPMGMAQMARGMQDRTQSGFGAILAGQMGIPRSFGSNMIGPTNAAEALLKALEKLSSKSVSNEYAIRASRELGIEGPVGLLRDASPGMRAKALAAQGDMNNPEFKRMSADYQISIGLFQQSWQKFLIKLTPAIELVTAIIEKLTGMIGAAGDTSWMGPAFGGGKSGASGKTVEEQSLKVQQQQLRTLNEISDGLYGGGGRSRQALPWSMGDGMANNAAYREGLRMGAFAI